MFDPVTFVIAAVLLLGLSIYGRSRRRRARAREFDGGYSYENEIYVTKIMCPHIRKARND
jgi:hypothetical protein